MLDKMIKIYIKLLITKTAYGKGKGINGKRFCIYGHGGVHENR